MEENYYFESDNNKPERKKSKNIVMDKGLFIMGLVLIIIVTMLTTYIFTDKVIYNGVLGKNKVAFKGEELDPYKIEKLQTVLDLINEYYYFDYEINDLIEGAITGLVMSLEDPYTNYLAPGMLEGYMNTLVGAYSGIGISYQVTDKGFSVINVEVSSPAKEAGVEAGDIITKINDINVLEYTDEMLDQTLGVVGVTSKLTLVKSDGSTKEVEVTAAEITSTSVTTKDMGDGIRYIRITQFDSDTGEEFKKAVETECDSQCKGLIIDLRNNPGGYENQATIVADTILPEGTIAYSEDKNGNEISRTTSDANEIAVPIVLLVNENSASASEYVTGAFKDFKKGTIIGTKTYGKGVGQVTFSFDDDSGITFTIARYFTPSGACIHGVGITPDIVVELSEEYKNAALDDIPFEDDLQLQRAIEELKK